jgi:RNA polymerase subunit RPABC4/transcription elongation factor Spt4
MDKAKKKGTPKETKCACPYCEAEMVAVMSPFCQGCGVKVTYCVTCQTALPKDAKVCPKCGGKIASK